MFAQNRLDGYRKVKWLLGLDAPPQLARLGRVPSGLLALTPSGLLVAMCGEVSSSFAYLFIHQVHLRSPNEQLGWLD